MATGRQLVVSKPVSGYVLGGAASSSRRKAWLYDLRRTVATGPDTGNLDRLVRYTGRCRFIRQMEGESCLS
jgi:hypothetical protein